ncbi:MAG: hypothetical protein M3Y08_12515 [Fibrobacterota bacterium]|nr:hypothetical protein [Fibrobacterota bacterium]
MDPKIRLGKKSAQEPRRFIQVVAEPPQVGKTTLVGQQVLERLEGSSVWNEGFSSSRLIGLASPHGLGVLLAV